MTHKKWNRCLRHFVLISFLAFPFLGMGQLNNAVFDQKKDLDSSRIRVLYLNVKGLGFVKNNEYFNSIVSGYTLFGKQFHPEFTFQVNSNLYLSTGVFYKNDFGARTPALLRPTFTIKYQKKYLSLLFGNIEGNLQHQLIEPIFDFERLIQDRLEQGLQLKYQAPVFKGDWWVNWRLRENRTTLAQQEEIEAGAVMDWCMVKRGDFNWRVLSHTLLLHKGGQWNTTNLPIFTAINQSIGFKAAWDFSKDNFIQQWSTENHYLKYLSDANHLPYKNGEAWYLNSTFTTKWGDLLLSYWNGNQYINLLGGDLYGSLSKINEEYEQQRELLFFRWLMDFKLSKRMDFTVRLSPFYDFKNDLLEYNFGLYLTYNIDFRLSKVKKANME